MKISIRFQGEDAKSILTNVSLIPVNTMGHV